MYVWIYSLYRIYFLFYLFIYFYYLCFLLGLLTVRLSLLIEAYMWIFFICNWFALAFTASLFSVIFGGNVWFDRQTKMPFKMVRITGDSIDMKRRVHIIKNICCMYDENAKGKNENNWNKKRRRSRAKKKANVWARSQHAKSEREIII